MALVLANRVQETSTTTGTGTLTLAGAVLGYQTFAAGIGSGNTCYYAITSTTGAWEVGIGTVGTGTLARTTLLSSSTGSLVSFTGTLNVYVTYPSEKSVNLDASGNTFVPNLGLTTASSGKFTALTNSALTSGRVPYAGTGGLIQDSANLTFNGTTLTAANDMSVAAMTVGLGGGALAQNVALGGVTLPFNTTGNFNVAVGYQSMFYNKIGTSNVGLGFATLFLNTTANQNLAMGVSALTVLTTGVASFGAITAGSGYTNGTYTAVAMTPVSGATFVTYPTVTVVVSGGAVTSVTLVTAGQGASSVAATSLTVAAALIGGTGSGFSIAVGSFVGGANNTAIGYQAGSTLATGSNNTLIGYQAAASSTTVSNEVTLGNGSVTAFRIPGLSITGAASALTIGSQFAVTNTASAVNYAQVTGAATGTAPVISAQGSDTNIDLTYSAKGTGNHYFRNQSGVTAFLAAASASAVDYFYTSAGIGFPFFSVAGASTNIGFTMASKGAGSFYFKNGASETQFVVSSTASAVNYVNTTGAATGAAPTISAQGSDANIGLVLSSKGTGVVALGGSTVANSGLAVLPVSSAVNYLQVAGAATTGFVNVQAKGTDANVGLDLISKGSNPIRFYTQAQAAIQFRVADAASTVNYYQVTGGATGSGAVLQAIGSDANINAVITPKGTGGVQFTGPLLPNNTAGTSGQVLTSAGAGAVPTWAAPTSSNITANGLFENNATISANYTIGSGNNAVSAGPITINSGVVVTVPSGSTWVVV